jgi:putative FmdB family regulatory protein
MPIYEYRCNECEREFERYVSGASVAVECPTCQSERVMRRLSVVSRLNLGASSSVPAGGMSGGGCCGGGCGCH